MRIDYFPNNITSICNQYNNKPIAFPLESLNFQEIENSSLAPSISISKAKCNDLQKFVKYLSPKGKDYFQTLLVETENDLER